jgi:ATP-dependent helicase/DNAse subunit B
LARKFVISPTKLRIYSACEAKYRLEYIDKIGKFYHRSRAGFAFGNSLHRALDAFHNAGGAETVPAEALTASLDELWVAKGYTGNEQEAAYRAEGVRILQEYHAAQQAVLADSAEREEAPPPPKVLFTEKTLRIDLSSEVALSGRVDRVDEHHDGSLEIVDYKSGRENVSEEDVSGSLALQIYQLLLKRKYPERRVFATLVALRTGSQASHELSDPEQEHLAAECLETGEAIRNKDWENVLPVINEHCPYCDFLPHCTRFWKQQERNG